MKSMGISAMKRNPGNPFRGQAAESRRPLSRLIRRRWIFRIFRTAIQIISKESKNSYNSG
jgi:hypothetical protein